MSKLIDNCTLDDFGGIGFNLLDDGDYSGDSYMLNRDLLTSIITLGLEYDAIPVSAINGDGMIDVRRLLMTEVSIRFVSRRMYFSYFLNLPSWISRSSVLRHSTRGCATVRSL